LRDIRGGGVDRAPFPLAPLAGRLLFPPFTILSFLPQTYRDQIGDGCHVFSSLFLRIPRLHYEGRDAAFSVGRYVFFVFPPNLRKPKHNPLFFFGRTEPVSSFFPIGSTSIFPFLAPFLTTRPIYSSTGHIHQAPVGLLFFSQLCKPSPFSSPTPPIMRSIKVYQLPVRSKSNPSLAPL